MSEQKRQKGKHLTWDDRHEIQNGLREHRSFKEIADIIGCSPDTISKEIRKHRYHKKQERRIGTITRSPNNCKCRETCRRKNVCNKKGRYKCKIPCRECLRCNELCPNFVFGPCPISSKAPYVCNNCYKSKYCLFDKYLYNASYAHKEYLEELHESRKGIDLTRDELAALDELVSPLIKKGQPLVHIMEKHKDEIPCSLRTLYHYIDAGYLTARNIDMRRTVRYRKRKHYVIQSRVSLLRKKGISIRSFRKYCKKRRINEL